MLASLLLIVLTGIGTPSAWARDEAKNPARDVDAAANPCNAPAGATAFRMGERWFDLDRAQPASVLPPAVAKRPELSSVTTALAVDKGWLVGSQRERHGGALRFVPPRGASVVLWSKGIRSLTAVGTKILATTLSPSEVLEVSPEAKARGGWTARTLGSLPSDAEAAFAMANDRLLVLTRLGLVSVGLDGGVRQEGCPDQYLTKETDALDAQAPAPRPPKSLPATVSGISEAAVRDHVEDAVAVLNLVLNHPRVVPLFHLDPSGASKPRVVQLPTVLPAKAFKVAGRDIEWVTPPASAKPASDFRFLDMELVSETVASVAFAHAGLGVEGYVMAAKQDGVWRVVGLNLVER